MKLKSVILVVIVALMGYFFWQYSRNPASDSQYYLYYKETGGKIGKAPLPAPSDTADGNIYMTGPTDPIVYKVGVGVSGELKLYSDSFDKPTSFSEVIPPDTWQLHATGAPWTTRMYKVFQAIEAGKYTKKENMTDEEQFIEDLYVLFSLSKNSSSFRDCINNPGEERALEGDFGSITKEMCRSKVPESLEFGISRTDMSFARLRVALFYKSYTEKKSNVCKPLLEAKFTERYEYSVEVSLYSYLLCEALATGDKYSPDIPLSEALRRLYYRFMTAYMTHSCNLYEDTKIRSMCEIVYQEKTKIPGLVIPQ